jgi:hypothetical protein
MGHHPMTKGIAEIVREMRDWARHSGVDGWCAITPQTLRKWADHLEAVQTPQEEKPERLVIFLYLLMRDSLVTGEVERLMSEANIDKTPVFSATHLENYARELAARLSPGSAVQTPPTEKDPL